MKLLPLHCLRFFRFQTLPALCLLATIVAPLALQARVGEARGALEARLLNDRRAVVLDAGQARDAMRGKRLPFERFLEVFPPNGVHVIYFKKDVADDVKSRDLEGRKLPDGWLLHVYYYGGRSVLESYIRVGKGITEPETNGILSLNQRSSYWQKKEAAGEAIEETLFGHQFVLFEDDLRAATNGGVVTVFDAKFDAVIRERWDVYQSKANAEAQQKAPVSISGF